MVWPSRVRRPEPKHAFEAALDAARLDDDGEPILDEAASTGPAVGSLGDIAVASGYVAAPSLARAYGADDASADGLSSETPAAARAASETVSAASGGPPQPTAEKQRAAADPPAEAARKLKAALATRAHSVAELRRLRRGFAVANHPDRVSEAQRAESVQAMAEVNAAIDQALKQAKRS